MQLHQTTNMTTQFVISILLIGLSAGILSGLVGVGGGIILVPALVLFFNYTQHQAQGTSLAVLTLPVVILASIKYYVDCKNMGTPIDLRVVGLLALGFIGGGYIGSSIALRIDQETLRKVFAIVLFYTAFRLLHWDAVITRWVRGIF
jgi:uncharacterized membrane protein YfcA